MPDKSSDTTGPDKSQAGTSRQPGFTPESLANTDDGYHFREILDSLPEWIWEVDKNGFITYSNLAVEHLLGFSRKKLQGKSVMVLAPAKDPHPTLKLLETQWGLDDLTETMQHEFMNHKGEKVYLASRGMPFYNNEEKSHGLRFISRLIQHDRVMSSSRFAALVTQQSNEAAAVMDANLSIVYINQAFKELFGYTEEEVLGKPLSFLGSDSSMSTLLPTDVTQELTDNQSWQGEVKRKSKDGTYIPCLLSAKAVKQKNFTGYIGTYFDLRPVKQSDLMVKNALKKTINAICKAIDDRNILKGQHQEKVTDLAVAIALDMGLEYDFIEGLTLASHLHDLGEIFLPPEMTSKNGPLNDVELALVKTHPEKSYNILKNIAFPWPVPDIILQHHERFDGSGYPRQLVGEEIMLQARIIAVADVVGTMLSDRPYRQACSIEECIEELEQNRGVLYDPYVVDACLSLIRENNYYLKKD